MLTPAATATSSSTRRVLRRAGRRDRTATVDRRPRRLDGQGDAVVDGRPEVPRRPLRLGRHRPRQGPGLLRSRAEGLLRPRLRPAPGLLRAGQGRAGRSRASPTPSPATSSPSARRCTTSRIYVGDNQMIEAPRPGKDVRSRPDLRDPDRDPPDRPRRRRPRRRSASVDASARVAAGTPYASLFDERRREVRRRRRPALGRRQAGVRLQPARHQPRRRPGPDAADARHRPGPRRHQRLRPGPGRRRRGAAAQQPARPLRQHPARARGVQRRARAPCSGTTASRRTPRPRTTSAPSCRRWRQHEPHDSPDRPRRRDHRRPRARRREQRRPGSNPGGGDLFLALVSRPAAGRRPGGRAPSPVRGGHGTDAGRRDRADRRTDGRRHRRRRTATAADRRRPAAPTGRRAGRRPGRPTRSPPSR